MPGPGLPQKQVSAPERAYTGRWDRRDDGTAPGEGVVAAVSIGRDWDLGLPALEITLGIEGTRELQLDRTSRARHEIRGGDQDPGSCGKTRPANHSPGLRKGTSLAQAPSSSPAARPDQGRSRLHFSFRTRESI